MAGLILIIGAVIPACASQPEPAVATESDENTNPIAAVQTLTASTTFVPPTPVGGDEVEGPDDYVGIVKQVWNIFTAEFVRDDFNGVEWGAVYDEYIALAEGVTSSEE
jgi:hypothetical protein